MTLNEWSSASKVKVETHTNSGAKFVHVEYDDPMRKELFHLTDFKVSSVSGPVHWLVPIDQPAHRCVKI